MNAVKDGDDRVANIPAPDIRAACESILASDMFLGAPRMSRLLRFLVEKAISGAIRDTSEYAIGIEVFDRDASVYNTNEDPIVRVQVGRLRAKLKTYYANSGVDSDIVISIPMGGYMPVIRRMNAVNNDSRQLPMFAIHPFKCVSHHENGETFMHGLHDELVHQLFKAFGKIIVARTPFSSEDASKERRAFKRVSHTEVNHRLEGSIQMDAAFIKTSIRLVNVSTGCIDWSEQFNRNVSLAIALQEEIASSICGALKRFFCHG